MNAAVTKRAPGRRTSVRIGRHSVAVSNLDKIFYPETGHTKGDVINYYSKIGHWMLPHLRARPVTLKRYPDGVAGFHFYEKNCPPHRPDWVKTAKIERSGSGKSTSYCLIQDMATLVWTANLASVELHTVLSRAHDPERPTVLVFDLDPGPGCDLASAAKVAVELHDACKALGLESAPKTSGSKGLQLYVPLNTPATFEATGAAARTIADAMQQRLPDLVVTNMRKSLRQNRVLIDWSQNSRHKTTVCVYSLRAREQPTPSAPLFWREVRRVARDGDVERVRFGMDRVVARAEKHGDIFEPVLKLKQKLPGV